MDPIKILAECSNIIDQRGQDYGGIEENFDRIAKIATEIIGTPISGYEVAMILVATKLARMSGTRDKQDNYLDAINYLAFASELRK